MGNEVLDRDFEQDTLGTVLITLDEKVIMFIPPWFMCTFPKKPLTPRDVMAIIEDAYLNHTAEDGYNAFMKECSYKIEQLFNQKI